jgi:hypothetical protein
VLFQADRVSQFLEVLVEVGSLIGELLHQVRQPVGDRVQLALDGLLVSVIRWPMVCTIRQPPEIATGG